MTGWVLVKPEGKPMVCVGHTPGRESAWQEVRHVPIADPPLVFRTRREARKVARHINTHRYEGWDKCVVRRWDEVFS